MFNKTWVLPKLAVSELFVRYIVVSAGSCSEKAFNLFLLINAVRGIPFYSPYSNIFKFIFIGIDLFPLPTIDPTHTKYSEQTFKSFKLVSTFPSKIELDYQYIKQIKNGLLG